MTTIIEHKKTILVIELQKLQNPPFQSFIGLETRDLKSLYLEIIQVLEDMPQPLDFDLDSQIVLVPRHKQDVSGLVSRTTLMSMWPNSLYSLVYIVAELLDISDMTIRKSRIMGSRRKLDEPIGCDIALRKYK